MSRNQEQDKEKLIVQLKKTPIVQVACERCGVPRSTYYRWHKNDEVFAQECDGAISESTGLINDMAESQLIKAIKESNMTAIIFWLKNHHEGYTDKLNVTNNIQIPKDKKPSEVIKSKLDELAARRKARDLNK